MLSKSIYGQRTGLDSRRGHQQGARCKLYGPSSEPRPVKTSYDHDHGLQAHWDDNQRLILTCIQELGVAPFLRR